MLKALRATGKPVVFVNCSGSAIAMPWEAEHLPAIVQAWYPGEEGGRAVAEILFGDVNPAGRLPVTFYRSTDDLPAFEDYSMTNRTYRYFSGKPLFAFGHGLSYTKFDYAKRRCTMRKFLPAESSGCFHSEEFRRARRRRGGAGLFPARPFRVAQAKLALCGFARIIWKLANPNKPPWEFPASAFRYWDTAQKKYVVEPAITIARRRGLG